MTYLIFIIKMALFDFSRNKGRTFLTTLGILIGIASVVLLLALGSGLREFIKSQFEGLGTNLIFVLPGRVLSSGGGGFRPGGGTLGGARFEEKDVARIRRIDGIEYTVPYFVKTVKVQGGGNSQIADLRGTTEENFIISHFEPGNGEFFEKRDIKKRNKVVVLGSSIAEKLFRDANSAVGKTVRIGDQGFKVIGVLKKKGDVSHNYDQALFIPYTSAFVFNPDKKFFDIHIQIKNYEEVELIKEKINESLLERYKEDDFSVVEQKEILDAITAILNAIGLLLVSIGGISLLVGGVGIMNIMYVSVTERRKEIGIRRAVGATKKDILFHFLGESILLALMGGVLGILISFVTVFFIRRFFPAYIDGLSVIIALTVSSIIGVFFGVFPAKKAADLSPIDAIRYE